MSIINSASRVSSLSALRRFAGRGVLLAAACLTLFAVTRSTAANAAQKPNPTVEMTFSDGRSLKIELFANAAPKTVAHFLSLVKTHFYDGILFHRVIAGFCAQAGDPKSKTVDGSKLRDISDREVAAKYDLGGGGSGKTVPLEAKMPHELGTLGLARSQDRDSGDSQFFFNLAPNHALDDDYCVFGKIISGKAADGKTPEGKTNSGIVVMNSIRQGDKIKSIILLPETSEKQ